MGRGLLCSERCKSRGYKELEKAKKRFVHSHRKVVMWIDGGVVSNYRCDGSGGNSVCLQSFIFIITIVIATAIIIFVVSPLENSLISNV